MSETPQDSMNQAGKQRMLKKQCACEGTSSGPRFTILRLTPSPVDAEGNVTWTGQQDFALMVCDVCETAWRFEK